MLVQGARWFGVTVAVVVLGMWLVAGSRSAAADEAETRAAIAAAYARMDAAIAARDLDAYFRDFASDFTAQIGTQPRLDLTTLRAAFRDMLPMISEMSQKVEILAIEPTGPGRVHVTARWLTRMTALGADGKPHVTEVDAENADSWEERNGAWVLVGEVEGKQRTTVDGVEPQAPTALPAEERAKVVAELRAIAHPFAGVSPTGGLDDLTFLDPLVGEARIVALGESSHGTAEDFRMKHRIIRYLVERKGFTVVAFEGSWAATDLLDAYVKGGPGTAAAGLDRLGFWTWRTEEVRDLVEWMRSTNAGKPSKPLSFTGFDMQDMENPVRCLTEGLAKLPEADRTAVLSLYPAEADRGGEKLRALDAARLAELLADANEAVSRLEARREAIAAATSAKDYERLRQCARIIVQLVEDLDEGLSNAHRDRSMAANVRWLADTAYPGEKIVLWAHNAHVGTRPGWMGGHLRETFGTDMVVLGFASHHGEVRAVALKDGTMQMAAGPVTHTLGPVVPNSLDDILDAVGLPFFVADLRQAPAGGALAQWLARPQLETSIGAGYDPAGINASPSLVGASYDAIVFIAESSAAVGLK